MSLPTRSLGRGGPQVTSIGLGLMSFASPYDQKDTSIESSLKFLDKAYDIGERFWDTADCYGPSEDVVGQWFKNTGKRSDIFLATKFGIGPNASNDPEYVRSACAKSLGRLGVDTIDLYYCHRIDDKTPVENMMNALVELKNQGKIRHIGLSECSANTIRRAHAVHPITAYQVEYNLLFLDIESEQTQVLQTCRELGITIVAYSPIGRGLLTGKYRSFSDLSKDDWRSTVPKFSQDNFPKILALVDKIQRIADTHKVTAAQVCIAWLLAQGDDIIPIPGTTTIKYLEDNTASAQVKLTKEEEQELRQAAHAADLPGHRYPTGSVEALLRESVPLK